MMRGMGRNSWSEKLYDLYVRFHALNQGDYLRDYLSPEFKQRFDALIKAAGKRGTVAATIAKMTEREAWRWMKELGSILSEVKNCQATKAR